jgi:hypothetical protein
MPSTTKLAAAPGFNHHAIDRLGGIKRLSWAPAPGVSVILGGGDLAIFWLAAAYA